ncbi:MAG: Gfo/Idh/MocA family oxidoreductase [Alphaproteobacteria bacterium]|nr:Gfo/Idh/MocA family oxidoreductase [Alphaproteobacteria bacterium]
MKKLNIGLVGCGRVSRCHFEAIKNNKDTMHLVAVCDRNEKNLSSAVKQTGANGYSDINDMLEAETLDAVAICTPNGYHYENAKIILKHNINVIVEKPLTLSFKEGQKLMKIAKKKGKHIFLIHQNRFNPTIQCVKNALDRGAFGKIYMITSNIFWYRDNDYYKKSSWHGSKEIDGGAFITQGSHYTDIMNWFAGDNLKSVYAVGKTLERDIETEDCGSAIIEWKNGIIGNVNLSILAYNENYEGSITILGQKGLVKIGGIALNKITDWKFDSDIKQFCDVSYDVDSVYGYGHTPYYKGVANTLLKGKPFIISDTDATQSLQLLCGIVDSMDKKKKIKF